MTGFPTLTLTVPDGQKLLAVATIAIDGDGEYQLRLANIAGSSVMTRVQQVNALRLLATGIEAETVYNGDQTDQVNS